MALKEQFGLPSTRWLPTRCLSLSGRYHSSAAEIHGVPDAFSVTRRGASDHGDPDFCSDI